MLEHINNHYVHTMALLQKLAKSGKIGELIKAKVGGYVRF